MGLNKSTTPTPVLIAQVKDVEISVPIVYGTIAFWLGRKATESQSHKWTVYVRGATNEDLSAVVKRVVFNFIPVSIILLELLILHPLSYLNVGGVNLRLPLHFTFIVMRLYPTEQSGPQSTKKPVVVESYDEIVFPDPSERFLARVQNHPAVVVPRLPSSLELPPSASTEETMIGEGRPKITL
ncbi:Transcription initiation factor TFIID subunit 14b [Bienertia sinuspersici]